MMMAMLVYALLLPTAVGFLFVAAVSAHDEKQALLERILLGFGIGMGMLTFEMFIIGMLGIAFTVFSISAVQGATAVVLWYLLSRRKVSITQVLCLTPYRREEKPVRRMSALQLMGIVLLSVWVASKLIYVLLEGSGCPVFTWDSLENWSSGGKFFFYSKGLALGPSQEHYFGRGYRTFLDYPLHIPLMQTWTALCLGTFHEVYVKIYNVFYFWSVIGLTFSAVKRETSAMTALAAAFFVSTVPLLTYHASEGYADLPLSYYALCATIYFRRYLETTATSKGAGNRSLWVMGTVVALGSWTKGEGILFTAAFTLALFFYLLRSKMLKNAWKDLLSYCIPILTVAIPWHLFVVLNGVGSGRGYENFLATGLHFEVLPIILKQVVLGANFNLIFLFFFTLLLFAWRPLFHTELKYLLFPAIGVMMLFLFVYLTTDNYLYVVNLSAINRNIMTFIPMLYYVSAVLAVRLLSHDRQRDLVGSYHGR